MAGFKRGAVVQLRSGGPLMTIETIEADMNSERMACCHWFDRAQRTWGRFALHMLEVVEAKGENMSCLSGASVDK